MSSKVRPLIFNYLFRGSAWTTLLSVGALVSFLSTPCWAGGLYIAEFGTPSTGVANAGAVAVGQDASAAWHNPASMTRLSGTQLMVNGGLLIPNVKFDPDSDTPVAGGDGGAITKDLPRKNLCIPSLGVKDPRI